MEDFKLCDDMVKTEILSRTSLKTLDAIRCINKEFEKLTYEPYLLHLYKQRNNMVSGFLMEDNNKDYEYIHKFAPLIGSKNIDLGFLPIKAKILASSEQGLIVFESPHPRNYKSTSYHICKPATKQVVPLPNPKTKYHTVSVTIVTLGSNPLRYKIVRLSSLSVLKRRGEFYTTYHCEVFDSRTWAWKQLDHLMLSSSVLLTYSKPMITTRGSIYMLLTNNDILKFDAYSEKWETYSSPISTLDDEFYTSELVKHEGRLGFACKPRDGCLEIWVLGSDGLWEKMYVINVEEDIECERKMSSFDHDPNTSVLFYKRNNVSDVVLTRSRMFVYRSDFEPTNLTGR